MKYDGPALARRIKYDIGFGPMLSQCLDRIYYIGPLPSRVRYYDVPLGSRRRADWSGHHRSVLQPTLFPAFNRCKTDIVVIVPTSEQSLSRASAESGPMHRGTESEIADHEFNLSYAYLFK